MGRLMYALVTVYILQQTFFYVFFLLNKDGQQVQQKGDWFVFGNMTFFTLVLACILWVTRKYIRMGKRLQ